MDWQTLLPVWQGGEWWVLLRDVLSWAALGVGVLLLASGLQDMVFDLGIGVLSLVKRLRYAAFQRLSLSRLRSREQQSVAIYLPIWQDTEISEHVHSLLTGVDYRNFTLFIGLFPNDVDACAAVEALAAADPRVVPVVCAHTGPTMPGHALNAMYRAMKGREERTGKPFNLVVLTGTEEVMHPYALLLCNYLMPRVDLVQLPLLPQPASLTHWSYWMAVAEFIEHQFRSLPVREKMRGLVPVQEIGVALSRRALRVLEARRGGAPFDAQSVTEMYRLSRDAQAAGLTTIFPVTVLEDDRRSGLLPLSRRPGFIANRVNIPLNFTSVIHRKMRAIIGMAFQKGETSGWRGSLVVKATLLQDRKVLLSLVTAPAVLLLALYQGISLTESTPCLPLPGQGSLLHTLIGVILLLLAVRAVQHVLLVSRVYGPVIGVCSLPYRLLGGALAAFAVIMARIAYRRTLSGGMSLIWEKIERRAEMARAGMALREWDAAAGHPDDISEEEILLMLDSRQPEWVLMGLEAIPRHCPPGMRRHIFKRVHQLCRNDNQEIRAVVARVGGHLGWQEMIPLLTGLLHDRDWVVRANAANALLKYPDPERALYALIYSNDRYAKEVFIRQIEQNEQIHRRLAPMLLNERRREAVKHSA